MRVRVLGRLEVSTDADAQLDLGTPKQRTLLAVLLTRTDQLVTVEQLIDELWPEGPPKSAVANVRMYAARLRRLFDAESAPLRLESRGPGYVIQVHQEQFDLAAFQDHLRRGREELDSGDFAAAAKGFKAALELWRGQPFADVALAPTLTARRAALCDEHAAAVEGYAEALLGTGREHPALALLRDHVDAHPLRERGWELLMTARYRAGDVAGALATYSAARARLVEELGIEPGAALQELHRLLLGGQGPQSGTQVAEPRPPAQLPMDVRGFAGRSDELARLDAILTAASEETTAVVISAVSGTAGVGKTALAVHWAHQVRHRFPDGQLYVNLRGFHPSGAVMTPAEAVRGFLDALGVASDRIPPSLESQAALYRTLLADKKMLVVLDNARDAEQVRPLLPGSPDCLAIVTSRSELTSLMAAEGAHPVPIDLLTTDEARDLLVRRLGAERVAAEPQAVSLIVARCARLPLALTIVAARTAADPHESLANLAADLAGVHTGLDILRGGDAVTDIRALFSWSYRLLSPAAARLFRLLGLHPGPHISAMAGASMAGIPSAASRPLLAELTRANLVAEHMRDHFGMHDLLRAYATELADTLDPKPDRDEAIRRLLDHYLQTAHRAAMLLYPHRESTTPPVATAGVTPEDLPDRTDAMSWFTTEHRVLLTAIQLAAKAGYATHAEHLTWTLWNFLDRRGQWHDWLEAERASLECAQRAADRPSQARAHYGLAVAYARSGRYGDAHTHHRSALGLYAELGDRVGQAHVHLNTGGVLLYQEQHRDAETQLRRSLDLYRAAGNRRGEARALRMLGNTLAKLGYGSEAVSHCQQALALQQALGDRFSEAEAWQSLGELQTECLGDHHRATTSYHNALGVFRELGDRYSEAGTLVLLGKAQHGVGHLDSARDAYTEALTILDDIGHTDADRLRARLRNLTADDDSPPPTG